VLDDVKFEFQRTNANGEEEIYYTITLTNARVASIHQFTNDELPAAGAPKGKSFDTMELEEVSFSFQKIEIESKEGKTMGSDDWTVN